MTFLGELLSIFLLFMDKMLKMRTISAIWSKSSIEDLFATTVSHQSYILWVLREIQQPLSKTDLALHWSFSFFSTKGQMLWSWGSLQIRGICLLTYKSYQFFLITCTDLLMLLVCWQGILEPRWCSDCLPALCCCPPDFSQWELTSSPADPPSTNQRQVHGQVMQEEPMRRWERTAAGGLSWH